VADRWYSLHEAADLLAMSPDAVTGLVQRGELPAVIRDDGEIRIPKPAFEFFASGRKPSPRRIVRVRVESLPRFGADEPSDPGVSGG
jgi:hypothetical protein